MAKIWKYQLTMSASPQPVNMPTGAQLLWFGFQQNEPVVWALVDPGLIGETRWLQVVGTGQEISDEGLSGHVGTVQEGPYVWHLFEVFAPKGQEA